MRARWSVGRLLLLAVGLALMAFGAVTGFTTVPSSQWPSAALWLAGGVAVHDAVLAPLAVAVGLLVLPRVRPTWRAPLRGGALGAGVLAVFALAVTAGAANRRNDSVVPVDPGVSLTVAGVVLLVAVLLGVVGERRRVARRIALRKLGRDRPPAGRPASGR
jgi:hypothetical protein